MGLEYSAFSLRFSVLSSQESVIPRGLAREKERKQNLIRTKELAGD